MIDNDDMKTPKSVSVFAVMDELMEAVKVLHPRMYNSVMQKIQDL